MYKSTAKRKHKQNFDVTGDVEKIKELLFDTAFDVKGKAGEIFSQQYDEMKEKRDRLQNGVASYTAEKPFKSLGIALFAGIVLGYFFHK